MIRRLLPILLCAVWLTPTPALAREWAVLLRSEPADGALLEVAPTRAQLWFSQPLDRVSVQVTLTDASGQSVAVAAPETSRYQPGSVGLAADFSSAFLLVCSVDPTRLPSTVVIELPNLAAGTYRLDWRADGLADARTYVGTLVFQIQPGAQPAAADPLAGGGVSQPAADLLVTLTVRPNRPGVNFVQLIIADTRRPAPAAIRRVLLRLTPAGGGPGELLVAEPLGAGRYQLPPQVLKTSDWQIDVVAERAGHPSASTSFAWRTRALVEQTERPPTPLWPLALMSLLFAVLGGIALIRTQRRHHVPADDLEITHG